MLYNNHLLIKILLNQEETNHLIDQMSIHVINNSQSNNKYMHLFRMLSLKDPFFSSIQHYFIF